MSGAMNMTTSLPVCTSMDTTGCICFDAHQCENIVEAVERILYNNTLEKNYTAITEGQEDKFHSIEQLREDPKTMFSKLCEYFTECFDINLHIIAFENNEYSLINYNTCEKDRLAFVLFDDKNRVRGCLCNFKSLSNDISQTVFSNNIDVLLVASMFVKFLNKKESPVGAAPVPEQQAVSQFQDQQNVHCAQERAENNTSAKRICPPTTDKFDKKHQSSRMLDQSLQRLFFMLDKLDTDPRTVVETLKPFHYKVADFENSSPQKAILACKNGLDALWEIVRSAEERWNSSQQYSADEDSNIVPRMEERPSLTRLLQDHHPRNLGEFAGYGKCPIKHVYSGQRDQLEIEVLSPTSDNIQLYLGMEFVNVVDSPHPSKIIVPDKTKAENEILMNTNDLKCLNFTECGKDFEFVLETKQLYSKITLAERQNRLKRIRAHAVNLYKRGEVKNLLKECPDPKEFKLSLWYSVRKNDKYVRVSPIFYSNIARETVKNSQTKRTKPTVKAKAKPTLKRLVKER